MFRKAEKPLKNKNFVNINLEEKRPNRPYKRDAETTFDILKDTIFEHFLKHIEF